MARKRRTDEELRKASDHLAYEVWMFRALASGMASNILGQGNPASAAVLEAFVIHARNLIYFMYADNPKRDNIVAGDFIPNWGSIRPKKSEYLSKSELRAHKEVAHLSYDRQKVTPETKPWQFLKLESEVTVVFKVFAKHVPKDLLGERWESQD